MIAARRPVRIPCLAHGWRRERTEWCWPQSRGVPGPASAPLHEQPANDEDAPPLSSAR